MQKATVIVSVQLISARDGDMVCSKLSNAVLPNICKSRDILKIRVSLRARERSAPQYYIIDSSSHMCWAPLVVGGSFVEMKRRAVSRIQQFKRRGVIAKEEHTLSRRAILPRAYENS